MEPPEGSETSADLKLTPGKYPKEHIQYSKPDESLKSRVYFYFIFVTVMANTGYSEECAYSMNSWTVCDSYHSWLFQAIPLMHVC